jgi:hypothetical protein
MSQPSGPLPPVVPLGEYNDARLRSLLADPLLFEDTTSTLFKLYNVEPNVPAALTQPPLRYPPSEGLHLLDAEDDASSSKSNADSKSSGASNSGSGVVLHAEARQELSTELTLLAHNTTSNGAAIELLERGTILRAGLLALARAAQRDKLLIGQFAARPPPSCPCPGGGVISVFSVAVRGVWCAPIRWAQA